MAGEARATRFEALDRVRCLQLLSKHNLGRLAVVISDQPLIFPVNYTLDGDAIVFRTDTGNKLHGAIGRPVAFEIDSGQSEGHHVGAWSVLVIGRPELIDAPREPRLMARLEAGPWNPGPREFWVRIRPGAVTGRRIVD
jgi:nitroimidazol reductase NimA-like FMN-containing flavoprotein (pyridoxamine 5'-phosphate oxidase superfamily)